MRADVSGAPADFGWIVLGWGAVLDELADLGASVAIAPDGDRVAHLVERGGRTHVAVHEIGSVESVTTGPGSGPAWRPR